MSQKPSTKKSVDSKPTKIDIVTEMLKVHPHVRAVKESSTPLRAPLIYYEDGMWQYGGEFEIMKASVSNYPNKCDKRLQLEAINYFQSKYQIEKDKLNSHQHLLATKNVVMDLSHNPIKTYKHHPSFLNTIQIPVKYDPAATCPNIDKFFEEVLVKDEYIERMWWWFGNHLWQGTNAQVAHLLYGPGENGRSTTLSLLSAFVGKENVCDVPLHKLSDSRWAVAQLEDKLAAISADIPSYKIKNTDNFKKAVTGDSMWAEHKHGQVFNLENKAKLTFCANQIPPSSDMTQAYTRRLLFTPMLTIIEKVDTRILNKLTTSQELSGCLNRSLEGLSQLQAANWQFPKKATEELLEKLVYPASVWAREFLTVDEEYWDTNEEKRKEYMKDYVGIPTVTVRDEFKNWCDREQVPFPSNNARGYQLKNVFKTELVSKSKSVDGKNERYYEGIKWVE